ncbi:MAG TPA: polyketide synthase, partial [Candidatus Deferrimicrobium sp.]|nr:polyketide synthase [Candidatus Deferrimicrobium sp.]
MSTEKNRTGMEIAVIGMAGRFPGAKNIDEFWEILKNGKETITFFTDEELHEAGVSSALLQNSNYVKANGILAGFDRFDASFFGYIPAEAAILAPQVRIFHECVWEGFENAGYMPETYNGRIGLYAGATSSSRWEAMTYLAAQAKEESGEPDLFAFAEVFSNSQLTDKDNLTTRISYKFNLTGPSFLIQTACSTSLVAVHLAAQGLINGECELAAAGGTAVNITRQTGYLYHEGGILSPDGHNRAFDARAKGTVAGDGTGVVVLKLLEDAEADGDYIHAVIKGSAINNDGFRKVGYTAPSVEGQAQVISTALYVAEVEPGSVTYVEAHGTGTELGDPVEVAALKLAFGN